jgi:protocatechuate 3,4-dioxygenase beta subunit
MRFAPTASAATDAESDPAYPGSARPAPMGDDDQRLTRRRLLELGVALPVSLAACSVGEEGSDATARSAESTAAAEQSNTLEPTPACVDGDEPTPPQSEGPFFTPESPERASLLEPGLAGTKLILVGAVVATDCTPVAGALLDFWQADADGVYDNDGYRLRGHQFGGASGGYRLETIVPGRYTGRTRHIHVKVQAPRSGVLTTQLYFPGEPGNEDDALFDPALVMTVREAGDGRTARFRFVLELA